MISRQTSRLKLQDIPVNRKQSSVLIKMFYSQMYYSHIKHCNANTIVKIYKHYWFGKVLIAEYVRAVGEFTTIGMLDTKNAGMVSSATEYGITMYKLEIIRIK